LCSLAWWSAGCCSDKDVDARWGRSEYDNDISPRLSERHRNGDRSRGLDRVAEDEAEKSPLDVNALSGEAAETHRMLKAALDQYKDARPAH